MGISPLFRVHWLPVIMNIEQVCLSGLGIVQFSINNRIPLGFHDLGFDSPFFHHGFDKLGIFTDIDFI